MANLSAAAAANSGTAKYATFYVADLFFGIDVLKVQEVLRDQQMTRVPLAPDTVRGLINLRGQIVTAIDMRRKIGLEPSATDTELLNIVVRSGEGAVSLLVDEISGVVEVDQADYEPPPQSLAAAQRDLLEGLYKLDGRLLLVLNTERVLEN